MATRTITISLVEQNLGKRTCWFYPRLSSADGDVVLAKVYKKTTNASGDTTIALPTKASGTITYDYKLPTDTPGVYSEGTFHLSAGSAIDLDDLIAAGGEASDTVIDYIEVRKIAFNLKEDCGAAMDGTTDDNTAWATALAYLETERGGTIFIPAGTSKIARSSRSTR